MTFAEWNLLSDRYRLKAEQRKFDFENQWNQVRILWAMQGNVFRGKNTSPLRPEDLIKLSWDKDTGGSQPRSPEEAKEIFRFAQKRLGSRIKKNGK